MTEAIEDTADVGPETVRYVLYHADGRIQQHGTCSSNILAIVETAMQPTWPGTKVLVVPDDIESVTIDVDYWVSDGVMTLRTDGLDTLAYTIAADGVAEVSFSVASGTVVTHDAVSVAIDDDLFEFASVNPGVFEFYFLSPPQVRDYTVVINAV